MKGRLTEGKHYAINADTGCWEWLLSKSAGYGRVRRNGKLEVAHRVAFETFVGPIPDGLVIDHLCRNRACINPEHLDPVTHSENCRRGVPFRPAHPDVCIRGHEPDWRWNGTQRVCRPCARLVKQRLRLRRELEARTVELAVIS